VAGGEFSCRSPTQKSRSFTAELAASRKGREGEGEKEGGRIAQQIMYLEEKRGGEGCRTLSTATGRGGGEPKKGGRNSSISTLCLVSLCCIKDEGREKKRRPCRHRLLGEREKVRGKKKKKESFRGSKGREGKKRDSSTARRESPLQHQLEGREGGKKRERRKRHRELS